MKNKSFFQRPIYMILMASSVNKSDKRRTRRKKGREVFEDPGYRMWAFVTHNFITRQTKRGRGSGRVTRLINCPNCLFFLSSSLDEENVSHPITPIDISSRKSFYFSPMSFLFRPGPRTISKITLMYRLDIGWVIGVSAISRKLAVVIIAIMNSLFGCCGVWITGRCGLPCLLLHTWTRR